jgi:hypothetical protein
MVERKRGPEKVVQRSLAGRQRINKSPLNDKLTWLPSSEPLAKARRAANHESNPTLMLGE